MAIAPKPPVLLPDPPARYDQTWVARFKELITANINRCVSSVTANPSLLLRGSSGKVYEVTIDDGTPDTPTTPTVKITHIQG